MPSPSTIDLTVVIPDHDSPEIDTITSTLVEKTSVLPNMRMMDDEETRIVINRTLLAGWVVVELRGSSNKF